MADRKLDGWGVVSQTKNFAEGCAGDANGSGITVFMNS
jgi:hypothetical protein